MLPRHPNVVSCFYIDIISGIPQILLEYVDGVNDGVNLSKLLSAGNNKDTSIKNWRYILTIAIQIADGMAHAHKNGLLHQDLTSNNIMITKADSKSRQKEEVSAMITDFGIVKRISLSEEQNQKDRGEEDSHDENNILFPGKNKNNSNSLSNLTAVAATAGLITTAESIEGGGAVDEIFGNWPYVSPERWRMVAATAITEPTKYARKETDIYSFGIILYELITGGTRPYKSDVEIKKAHPVIQYELYRKMHCEEEVRDIMQFRNDCPSDIDFIILKCLQKDPEKRYHDFDTIRDELIDIYQNMIIGEEYNQIIIDSKFPIAFENYTAIEYLWKGVALANLGKDQESIVEYDKAIAMEPNLAVAYNNKGNSLANLDKYDKAIVEYDKAIKVEPNHADARYNKGVALNNLGRYKEAIVEYDKAIALEPNAADVYNNKGVALAKLDKYKEAIVEYDKAIKVEPNNALAYNNRAIALQKLKESSKGFGNFKRFFK